MGLRAVANEFRWGMQSTRHNPWDVVFGLFFPVALLLLFGSALAPDADVRVLVVDEADNDASRAVVAALFNTTGVRFEVDGPFAQLERGDADAVLNLPAGFALAPGANATLEIHRPDALPMVREAVRAALHDAAHGPAPAALHVTADAGDAAQRLPYRLHLVGGMAGLSLFTVATTLTLAATSAHAGAGLFRRLAALPVRPLDWVLAKTLQAGLWSLLGVGLVAAAAWAWLDAPVHVDAPLVLLAASASLFFAALGVLAGAASKARAAAILPRLLYVLLVFTGGVFAPVDALPAPLRAVSAINPLTYFVEGFGRSAFLDGAGALWIAYLAGTALVVALAARFLPWTQR